MAFDQGLADRIRRALETRADVEEKHMFGGVAFMVRDHMCCGVVQSSLMVRIDPDASDHLLRDPNVRSMDVTGRPMRGFLFVDGVETDASLLEWLDRAVAYAETMPMNGVNGGGDEMEAMNANATGGGDELGGGDDMMDQPMDPMMPGGGGGGGGGRRRTAVRRVVRKKKAAKKRSARKRVAKRVAKRGVKRRARRVAKRGAKRAAKRVGRGVRRAVRKAGRTVRRKRRAVRRTKRAVRRTVRKKK